MREIGHCERWDWELLLTGETQGLSAGDQDAEARTECEQGSKLRRGLDHVLEVVQQEKQVPVAQSGL